LGKTRIKKSEKKKFRREEYLEQNINPKREDNMKTFFNDKRSEMILENFCDYVK